MKNHKLQKIFFLLGSIFFLTSKIICAQEVQENKADLFLYEGHRQLTLGNNSDAFELFRHSLQLNPKSASALAELSQFWNYMRNDSLAMDYLKRATEYDPDNYWMKESLVEQLVNSGKTDEAIAVLESLSKQFPDKEDVLMMLENLYTQKQDYDNVVKILDRLEIKEGKSEQLSMEKFRTYVQMKDEEKAFQEMSELADEYPNDPRYRVLLGDLYVGQDRFEEGLKIYKEVEEENPNNVYLMASILNYYSRTSQDSLYNLQIEKICLNPKLDNDTRLRFLNSLVMQNLQENQNPDHLISIFKKVQAMPQADTQILELNARFMATLKLPGEEVKPVLNQILEINPENELARSMLLNYAVEAQDTMEIINVCRPAVDYSVNDPIYYYYLGIAYYQTDSAQLAVDTYKKGFTKVDENTNLELLTNMYILMGDAYYKLKDRKHVYECYDSCLMYRPDEALVLNNYAYYLSLENKQLDKAAEMSRRALKQEGTNYTYLDTYAWILFQQKKYAEAKVYIDSTLAVMADSVSNDEFNIIEHAGDIYSKNGLTNQAMDYWQQSLDMGNKSVTLLKKLKKKKYVEGKGEQFE